VSSVGVYVDPRNTDITIATTKTRVSSKVAPIEGDDSERERERERGS